MFQLSRAARIAYVPPTQHPGIERLTKEIQKLGHCVVGIPDRSWDSGPLLAVNAHNGWLCTRSIFLNGRVLPDTRSRLIHLTFPLEIDLVPKEPLRLSPVKFSEEPSELVVRKYSESIENLRKFLDENPKSYKDLSNPKEPLYRCVRRLGKELHEELKPQFASTKRDLVLRSLIYCIPLIFCKTPTSFPRQIGEDMEDSYIPRLLAERVLKDPKQVRQLLSLIAQTEAAWGLKPSIGNFPGCNSVYLRDVVLQPPKQRTLAQWTACLKEANEAQKDPMAPLPGRSLEAVCDF